MLKSNADLLMHLVDLMIIVLTIGILLFVLFRGMLKSRAMPGAGRILLVTGIVLVVAMHLVDFSLSTQQTSPAGAGLPHNLSSAIPPQLHWLASRIAFTLIAVGMLLVTFQRTRAEATISKSSAKVKAAEYGMLQSEARFRYLIETTSNSVYCFEFDPPLDTSLPVEEQIRQSHDAVLVECNQSFATDLEAEHPSQVIGSRMSRLDSSQDTEAHNQYFKSFIENDYRLTDYEMIYKAPDGNDRALRISLTGFVRDGYLQKMWGAESNVLDLRETKAALQRRQRFQEHLADVSSRLVVTSDDDADAELQFCLRAVCRYIGADRTTLIWLDKNNDVASVGYFWNELDVAPMEIVPISTFPNLYQATLKAETVDIADVDDMPEEHSVDRASLTSMGAKSFLSLPMIVAGEVVGALTYSHITVKRSWTEQDILEMRVFADLFANFVLRLKSYRELDSALVGLKRATDRLEAENVYLKEEIKVTHGFDEIVGQSKPIMQCLHKVERVANTLTPVLILGETGTGKELIARAIHEHSDRSNRPLVKINCAALPANLIESELFGFEKGAFTGAHSSKRGRFELAHESALFLDEIGEIPIDLQAKLLRILQEGEFERLGGSETIKVDVRIIAATNRDLTEAVKNGQFRSDLYYRVNTFPIVVPPLRARDGDIRLLAEHFVKVHSLRLGREVSAISASMMQQLNEYSWPGNIRELESVIQRALISATGSMLELAEPLILRAETELSPEPRIISSSITDLRMVEREHIVATLEDAGWKISGQSGAASRLGIPPSTLRSKMKKLAIVRPQ